MQFKGLAPLLLSRRHCLSVALCGRGALSKHCRVAKPTIQNDIMLTVALTHSHNKTSHTVPYGVNIAQNETVRFSATTTNYNPRKRVKGKLGKEQCRYSRDYRWMEVGVEINERRFKESSKQEQIVRFAFLVWNKVKCWATITFRLLQLPSFQPWLFDLPRGL